MDPTAKRRRDLEKEMNRRRAQLQLNWDQVASRAGISLATLRRARKTNEPMSLDTMLGIDRALEWEEGHVEARLAAAEHEHSPPADSTSDAELKELLRQAGDLRNQLQKVLDRIDELGHELDHDEDQPASA